ncbi:MAG: hypothetical protein JSR45_08620 [Proteobacteria bacterium]|nr:hypothetical protein [Pseudomonadota bacterium]
MRVSLFGLNVLAMGVLAAPAILIYQSAVSGLAADDVGRTAYPAAMVLGALCLFGAMSRLSKKRAEPSAAIPLMLIGTGLFAVPVVMLLVN